MFKEKRCEEELLKKILESNSVKSDFEKMIELNDQIIELSNKPSFKLLDEKSKKNMFIQKKSLSELNCFYSDVINKIKKVKTEEMRKKRLLNECLKEIGVELKKFEEKYVDDSKIQAKMIEFARTTKDKKKRDVFIEKLKVIDEDAGEEFVNLLYAALLNDKVAFDKCLKKCDIALINSVYYLYDSVFLDIATNLLVRVIEIGNYDALNMFLSLEDVDVNILETVNKREFVFNNPLIAAVKAQDEKKLRLLLKNDADVNISNDPYFKLPIYYAVEVENYDIFEILARKTKFSSLNQKMCLEEKEMTYLEYICSREDKFYYELLQKIFKRNLKLK